MTHDYWIVAVEMDTGKVYFAKENAPCPTSACKKLNDNSWRKVWE